LLARSGVEGDQRVAALELTAEGEAVLARVEAAMVALIVDLCDQGPEGEQALRSLAWMGTAIERRMAERRASGGR
jgi:DNA-binding MarR family transcriptional regulator